MSENFLHKSKVFAYIIRKQAGKDELLIFAHCHYPGAGLQVPAGTVEEGEELWVALKREVQEESGLSNFQKIQYLGNQDFIHDEREEIHHRAFFVLLYEQESPRTFQFTVEGSGSDQGLVFNYTWIDIEKLPGLSGDHDYFIPELKKYLSKNR